MARGFARVFFEALVVAMATVCFGYLVAGVFYLSGADVPFNWEIGLVFALTGFALHLFFEYSPFGNLNESYCRLAFAK